MFVMDLDDKKRDRPEKSALYFNAKGCIIITV